MDARKTGQFLAELRKERGWTQEQLGESMGVTNKTVSRWENGNYLPPAEILQELSRLYGITINEILSGEHLTETQYKAKAEENITAVMKEINFSRRERFTACGEWLRKYWWVLILCLTPSGVLYALRPSVVGEGSELLSLAISLLALGIVIIINHVVFYVSGRAYEVTKKDVEFRTIRIMRVAWIVTLGLMIFVSIELLLALLYSLIPAGTVDGYVVHSIFYDVLIEDHGIYPDNCYQAVQRLLWQTFWVIVINIDLAVLWIRKK